jgi:hypothetical protein
VKRASFGFLALALVLVGCPTSTTSSSPYTPITGIEINAATLTYGFGCGTGNDQVFMYAGVVSYTPQADANIPVTPPEIVTSAVYDCFTNGLFSNLPASEAGTLDFTIQIFAFNAALFPPELSCANTLGGTTGVTCPGNTPRNVLEFTQQDASWTTTCTATQVQGATVPAICGPLVLVKPLPGDAGAGDAGVSDSAAAD